MSASFDIYNFLQKSIFERKISRWKAQVVIVSIMWGFIGLSQFYRDSIHSLSMQFFLKSDCFWYACFGIKIVPYFE